MHQPGRRGRTDAVVVPNVGVGRRRCASESTQHASAAAGSASVIRSFYRAVDSPIGIDLGFRSTRAHGQPHWRPVGCLASVAVAKASNAPTTAQGFVGKRAATARLSTSQVVSMAGAQEEEGAANSSSSPLDSGLSVWDAVELMWSPLNRLVVVLDSYGPSARLRLVDG